MNTACILVFATLFRRFRGMIRIWQARVCSMLMMTYFIASLLHSNTEGRINDIFLNAWITMLITSTHENLIVCLVVSGSYAGWRCFFERTLLIWSIDEGWIFLWIKSSCCCRVCKPSVSTTFFYHDLIMVMFCEYLHQISLSACVNAFYRLYLITGICSLYGWAVFTAWPWFLTIQFCCPSFLGILCRLNSKYLSSSHWRRFVPSLISDKNISSNSACVFHFCSQHLNSKGFLNYVVLTE